MSVALARPTAASMKSLKDCGSLAEALETNEFLHRLKQAAPRHLSPERMLRVLVLAVSKTPQLAEAPLREVLGAMLVLSSLGLEPNTPMGLAYLIPFKKRGRGGSETTTIQVIIGYRGYLDLMRRTGALVAAHADVVYEGDEFSFEYGSHMHLRHVPRGARENRQPEWAYAHVKLKDGEAFEVLPYAEVLHIRDGSQAYQNALRSKNAPEEWKRRAFYDTPWVKNEHEMAAKTLIRRIAKMVPMSIEFANAAELDSMADSGRVDLTGALEPGFSVEDMSAIEGPETIDGDAMRSPPPPPAAAGATTRRRPDPKPAEPARTPAHDPETGEVSGEPSGAEAHQDAAGDDGAGGTEDDGDPGYQGDVANEVAGQMAAEEQDTSFGRADWAKMKATLLQQIRTAQDQKGIDYVRSTPGAKVAANWAAIHAPDDLVEIDRAVTERLNQLPAGRGRK